MSPELAAALMGGQANQATTPNAAGMGMGMGKPQGGQPPMPQGPGGQLPPDVAASMMMGGGSPGGGPGKLAGGNQPPPPLGSLPDNMGQLPAGAISQQLNNPSLPWYAIPGIQGGAPPQPAAASATAPIPNPLTPEQQRMIELAKLYPPADPWNSAGGNSNESGGGGGGSE